jgi:hypothetical protein
LACEFVAKHCCPSKLRERFDMSDVAGAAANAFLPENELAKRGIIVNVLGGTAWHVNGWENALVQLIVDLGSKSVKTIDNLVLFF